MTDSACGRSHCAAPPQTHQPVVLDDAEQGEGQPVQIFAAHLQSQLAFVQPVAAIDPVPQGGALEQLRHEVGQVGVPDDVRLVAVVVAGKCRIDVA